MRPASAPLPTLRRVLGPWRALWLVALLLAAQAAGLAHRVAHGPQAHGAAEHVLHWGHAAPGAHAHHAHADVPAGAHAGSDAHAGTEANSEVGAECRLYDQLLGHADALFGADVAHTQPVSPAALPLPQRPCHRRGPAAAFQARAPPLA